ncbi:MAG TPA: SRPBCC family protein [Blastocatellia bacterium]|nr:SRPBCC family protein [Blastocatellia bacterium]
MSAKSNSNEEQAMTDLTGWLESTHRELRRAGNTRSVFLRRRFDASIEKVWSACVERESLSQWFGDVSGDLREDGVLAIDVGMKEKVTSRILRCERPNQLVVTWSYDGDPRDPADQVEMRLSSDGAVTVMELEHRSGDEGAWNLGIGPGWEDWVIRLGVLLRGGDPAEVSSGDLQPRLEPLWAALAESEISGEPSVKVSVSRRFSVSPERVFDACLDPEMIGKWMFGAAVREEEVLRIAVDARVGGSFSFLVRRQGEEIDHIGKYREIVRPRRLVFTWGIAGESDDESVVIIEIVPLGTGAELTLTHELDPKWADYASSAEASWAKMLDAFVATLS